MKANKKVVISTATVLGAAALIAGGTIAYFTDNESKTNTFTVGNVDVTLYESQLHRVNANVGSFFNSDIAAASADNYSVCVPYMDHGVSTVNPYCTPNIAVGTDLSGVSAWQNGHVRAQNVAGVTGAGQRGVFTDAQIIADATGAATDVATASDPGSYAAYADAEYDNLVPGKQVRKFVYVKNTGANSTYARVKVTIPANVANLVTVKAPHTPTETSTPSGNTNIDGVEMGAYITKSESIDATTGDKILTFVYTDALKPGELTYWSPITTVKINDTVKESDFGATTLETLRSTGFGVKVDVDAIQSDGFADATAAWAAFDANAAYENEHDV